MCLLAFYSSFLDLFKFFILFLNLDSLLQLNSTGTTKRVISAINIPPKLGMAIGIIISLPFPVEVKIGNNARIVVAVVIKAGRILFFPASTTDALISFTLSGSFLLKVWVR